MNTCPKDQLEDIQGQINKIRNSVDDRQSWIAWHRKRREQKEELTENKTKSYQPKRKTPEVERTFDNNLENPPEMTDWPI